MEKNRWSLIFIGLCLVLVFSVSSVEAQDRCDRDGDGYVKDIRNCRDLLGTEGILGIDCNDNSFDDSINGGEPCEPSGSPCAIPNVLVGWVEGGSISEDEDKHRLCVPAMIQQQDSGSYTCAVSAVTDDPVMFNLDHLSLEQIQKQGNDAVCSYFEVPTVGTFLPSRLYNMSWAGPCLKDDPCLIRVAMWSHMTEEGVDGGTPIVHDPDGNPNTAIELGFTRVVVTLLLDEDVCNPITPLPGDPPTTRTLEITDISIRVQRPGNSHKIMADCQWPSSLENAPAEPTAPLFLIAPAP